MRKTAQFHPISRFLTAALCQVLAGCAFPAGAPTVTQIENSSSPADFSFTSVTVDKRIAAALYRYKGPEFGDRFTGAHYIASNRLRPGDVIAVAVYETGGPSLFPLSASSPVPGVLGTPTTSGSATTIPPQIIESDGTIMMPFVGRVEVAGKTPAQVGKDIQGLLEGKAVGPQVVVTLINNATNTATVGGDVNLPRPVPLSLRGERLLDVIAAAGGAKYPAYETYVRVVRNGAVGLVLLQTVVTNPKENIAIRPNDQVFLTRNPRTFAVLGATQKVSQYTFDTERVTLAEAVARAGGPLDAVGNLAGIYLFRFEPWFVAKDVLPNSDTLLASEPPKFVPILYRIDFSEAQGYFLAQTIDVRDKDVILIANAEAVQIMKMLAAVRGFTGIAYDLSKQVSGSN